MDLGLSLEHAGRQLGVDPSAVRREGAVLDRSRFDELVGRLHAAHGATLRVTG